VFFITKVNLVIFRERWDASYERIKDDTVFSRNSCINQANVSIVPNRLQIVKSSVHLILTTYRFSDNIGFISTLVPITVLVVDCSEIFVDTLLKLIQLLIHLNSLTVSSISLPKPGCLSVEEERTRHWWSTNNIITGWVGVVGG
jgi:hypothetical protein